MFWDVTVVMIDCACFLPRRGEYKRAFWIRPDVKGTMYRVAAPPFTYGLRQDSVSLSAGGGEEDFKDGVRFSGRCWARGHRPWFLWLSWKGRLGSEDSDSRFLKAVLRSTSQGRSLRSVEADRQNVKIIREE